MRLSVSEPVTPEDESAPANRSAGSPLTARVIALGLALVPLNAWWIAQIEYVRYSDNTTTQALFFNTVTLLLALVGLNGLWRRLRPDWELSNQELGLLYVIVVAASNLAGHDQLQILFTTITYLYSHANSGNHWGTDIAPYVPGYLVVHDKEALGALYAGHSTLYRWDHIRPWLIPLGWWSFFAMLLVWTMFCMAAIFRRQWEDERLSYPIAEIPLMLITQPGSLARSAPLWAGVTIGVAADLSSMIHSLVPGIPGVPIGVTYYQPNVYPWTAMGAIPISSFPFAYGLCFLLPTQLGFSCWFFMLLSRAEMVVSAMQGYAEWGKFPYIQQQGVGAIMGIFLTIIWAARMHLKRVWRSALGDADCRGYDAGEPLSYRLAVFGLLAGFGGLALFAIRAGMRWDTACLYLTILLGIVLVLGRLRAELGLPTFELFQQGADQILLDIGGTNAYTHRDLSVMSLFYWLGRTHRQFPMQNQLDALRIGNRTATPLRAMSAAILGASALGIVCAFWAYLHTVYQTGFESAQFRGPAPYAFGFAPWDRLDTWLTSPAPPDRGAAGGYLFGCLFALFLTAMRLRFIWWPFHPVGYMVAGSFGLFRLWLPIFLSWLIKTLVLRYGGLSAYRRALPFFIGLLLGEFAMGFVRTWLDLAFGLRLPPESGIGGL